jgi:hypothetical protein
MNRCRRRRRVTRVIRLHHRTISKFVALCLVVLGLLPFSAPFKTFDFADTHSDGPTCSLKDKVGSDEDLVGPPDESLSPPLLTVVVIASFTGSSQVEEHPLSSIVLRL